MSRPALGDRLQQRLHQQDIDHRRLVDDQQIADERIVAATLEAAGFRVNFQQPMDGLGLISAGFRHPLGGAAGRRAEQQAHALGGQNAQDGPDDGGLTHAGPSGDDQDLRHQSQADGGDLARCQRQTGLSLDPGQRLLRIDGGPWQRAVDQAPQSLSNTLLGPVETAEEHTRHVANRVRDHRSLGQFEIQGREHQLVWNRQ